MFRWSPRIHRERGDHELKWFPQWRGVTGELVLPVLGCPRCPLLLLAGPCFAHSLLCDRCQADFAGQCREVQERFDGATFFLKWSRCQPRQAHLAEVSALRVCGPVGLAGSPAIVPLLVCTRPWVAARAVQGV